jgi:hypothetical protein
MGTMAKGYYARWSNWYCYDDTWYVDLMDEFGVVVCEQATFTSYEDMMDAVCEWVSEQDVEQ